ncbi:MAG TPA: MBL fold metallo-hydrolase, partial [Gammaproteobacteria bacterium]|nr:MBL fold metallo-hydrolase [Gammaproteobacteria bacterium]
MRFCSLGSGSRGNGTVVQSGNRSVLIDCGFPFKELCRRLALRQLQAEDLDAILVTHEHGDHWRGVGVVARKLNIPVFMTKGTYRVVRQEKIPEIELFNCHQSFQLDDLTVQPFPVPHDAVEAAQFVFEHEGSRLGIATDLGSVSNHVTSMLTGCDALLMEFNHDEQMLREGPYSASLKRRVGGNFG